MARANVSSLGLAAPSPPVVVSHLDRRIPHYLCGAAILICLLIGGLGGWAAVAKINGAVVAPASVASETKTNVVQHLDGGVVRELLVNEGDLVAAGQLLVRLDRTEVDDELKGLEAELSAKTKQQELFKRELATLLDLADRGLVPRTRVVAVERDLAGTSGDIGRVTAQQARATERLKRLEIRAPLGGRILNLTLHTIGGVIAPGKELMQIVPSGSALVLEAKLPPKDIDQVHADQSVLIRLSGLNQRTTPQLTGAVLVVSPDLVHDEARNTQYYTARIAFNEGELDRLHGIQLIPGMPADIMIQTDARSALSYLVKPLRDQIARTFREQ
ncbi:MAG TPA: HlyD family efflux transporter periplasmic adaptor subunit [Hyphomicrobiaceae bacterium]|nr:HlyD family efflux transporter periplasmic adaptor subunit [Hyphomicrobiaceae bacterium]